MNAQLYSVIRCAANSHLNRPQSASSSMTLREQIISLWLRVSRPEQRTRDNFRGFYRRTLHNFGARGIFEATENAAGNYENTTKLAKSRPALEIAGRAATTKAETNPTNESQRRAQGDVRASREVTISEIHGLEAAP